MKARDPWAFDVRGLVLAPFVLRVAQLMRRPLAALGVDYEAFRALVTTRFLLDRRGPFAGLEGQFQIGFLLLLAFAWLSGIVVGIAGIGRFVGFSGSAWIGLVSLHAFGISLFVMLVHLGTLIVDGTDVAPIAARPVSDRTLFAVRVAHVGAYTAAIASTSMFWPMLLGWLGNPWWAVLFFVPVAVVLGCATAVGLVAAGFTVLLVVFGPTRFQRATFWAQIGATAFFFGGFRVVGPIFSSPTSRSAVEEASAWAHWVPPFASGALFDLVNGAGEAGVASRALVAVLAPIALLAVALGAASSGFVRGLSSDVARETPPVARWPRPRLARIACRSRAELAGYGLAAALAFRDKVFLRAFVPTAAMLLGAIGSGMGLRLQRLGLPAVIGALPLYLLVIVPPMLAELLSATENDETGRVLDGLPIERRVDFQRGALRALILRIAVPIHALAALFLLLVADASVHPVIAAAVSLAIGLSVVPAMRLRMPFSRRPRPGEMSMDNVPPVFAAMGLAALAAGLHFAASLHGLPTTLAGILAAAGLPLAWKRLERIREPLAR